MTIKLSEYKSIKHKIISEHNFQFEIYSDSKSICLDFYADKSD